MRSQGRHCSPSLASSNSNHPVDQEHPEPSPESVVKTSQVLTSLPYIKEKRVKSEIHLRNESSALCWPGLINKRDRFCEGGGGGDGRFVLESKNPGSVHVK